MTAFVYAFFAALFLHWIISRQEDPQIFYNAIMAISSALLFICFVVGVFELCGCVM
jgi:hypothetical protein